VTERDGSGQLKSWPSTRTFTVTALSGIVALLCARGGNIPADCSQLPLIGRWAGKRVLIQGDYAVRRAGVRPLSTVEEGARAILSPISGDPPSSIPVAQPRGCSHQAEYPVQCDLSTVHREDDAP
jgi:hypothetical protein